MKRHILWLGLGGASLFLAFGPAMAQQAAKMTIAEGSSYELSLRCYQFYDVQGQIATARAARATAGSPQAAEYATQLQVIKATKNAWNKNIDVTKEKRKSADIDAELAKAGEPIIADANASLGGDEAAKGRMEALRAECKAKESLVQG